MPNFIRPAQSFQKAKFKNPFMSAELLPAMRNYFQAGHTQTADFRISRLRELRALILRNDQAIQKALYADLRKLPEEVWLTEIGLVLAEIDLALSRLTKWMRPQRKRTNLLNFPSSCRVEHEPLGVVLIIAPWNYPFMLQFVPLVGALAAGNCVVVKPSEHAPASSTLMAELLSSTFSSQYILPVTGPGEQTIPALMQGFRFDHVFYTGGAGVAQKIYEMAARQLVPVTLELGGKSPAVVEADTDITVSAKRIASTRFSNAGQMCIAPDYLLVHEDIRKPFTEQLIHYTRQFYEAPGPGGEPQGKIIHTGRFNKLKSMLVQGTILSGGKSDERMLHIEPTILTDVDPDSPLMREEIFGPLLPVFYYRSKSEALALIARNPNPLAFYIYTRNRQSADEWLRDVPSGGACINNCSWHLTNPNLPFGGRGASGIGRYHGRYSFETFSHAKAVMHTPFWFDPALRYPPVTGKLNLIKKFF
jgi:aldehyde dehydrogenase (NAD+)